MTRGSDRRRTLFGVHLTAQLVLLVLAACSVTTLAGLAVLDWLERMA